MPDYLRDQFFPAHAEVFKAAIATGGDYFCQASPRWAVPRFVCGEDWKSPKEFEAILIEASQRTGLNFQSVRRPAQDPRSPVGYSERRRGGRIGAASQWRAVAKA
ncbi:MAG: hypothetical protein CM15mP74_20510 [Halieaceae bacterium]|nr:MAG: hypothetical protein CM15mP74_20510 [Halieaceae bacterium]